MLGPHVPDQVFEVTGPATLEPRTAHFFTLRNAVETLQMSFAAVEGNRATAWIFAISNSTDELE